MIVLGIIAAGGVFTGTNPGYTPRELAHHVSVTKSKIFIVEPELLAPMHEALRSNGLGKPKIFLFDHDSQKRSLPSWTSLLGHGEKDWIRFNDELECKNTTAALLTTSGTTGLPKAAMISHHNLIAEHMLGWERNLHKQPWETSSILALPMFHAAMGPFAHTSVLRSGFVVHVMRKFDVDEYMRAIDRYKPTEMIMVPPVVLRVVMSPNVEKYDLTSLKRAYVGAAPCDPELQKRFEALIGGPLTQGTSLFPMVWSVMLSANCLSKGWGMTEACCLVSMTSHPDRDIGSVGPLIPNTDIKFVDDNGNEVTQRNTRGEMCVRGPTIIRGYFENLEANARDFDSEGYYHTGDIGLIDEKDRIWIVDRKKELIKVRGFQVAPNEIEGILLSHPAIVDAAVIGLTVPSSPDAELVRACVVLRESQRLSGQEVMEYVEPQLAKYKRLTGGVRFMPAIPKTASGKILKRLLREEAQQELRASVAKL